MELMERTCKKCGETKPIEDFVKQGNWYRHICKLCQKEYQRQHYFKNRDRLYPHIAKREKLIAKKEELFKSGFKICTVCGETKRIEEFHKDKRQSCGRLACCKRCKSVHEHSRYINDTAYRHFKNCNDYQRTQVSQLKDRYILKRIHFSSGLSYTTIRQHPELIDNYKKQILFKRKLKTFKNENLTTSKSEISLPLSW